MFRLPKKCGRSQFLELHSFKICMYQSSGFFYRRFADLVRIRNKLVDSNMNLFVFLFGKQVYLALQYVRLWLLNNWSQLPPKKQPKKEKNQKTAQKKQKTAKMPISAWNFPICPKVPTSARKCPKVPKSTQNAQGAQNCPEYISTFYILPFTFYILYFTFYI